MVKGIYIQPSVGDGNITRKFELIYDNEGCNADNEEVDRRVRILLCFAAAFCY